MRLPKHATVVSYLALSVALGGSAYAATGGTFTLGHANYANKTTSLKNTASGPALKVAAAKGTPPLAVSNGTKIANLNADKVDGLHSTAFQRKGYRIYSSISSGAAGEQPAGSAGPWTFGFTCAGGGPATFTVHGPGTIAGTTSLAAGSAKADTWVGGPGQIGAGASGSVGSGGQMSQTLFLQNNSTVMEVQVVFTATNGGLFETCTLIGSATPVP
jgi:hypothetical protein